jgi:hypothetical protein
MAKQGIYRTGRVAEVLGLSPHQVRRLCETGLIQAELGPGGHWRIPATEVARLQKEGAPPIPSATNDAEPPRDEIRNRRAATVKVSSHHDFLRPAAQTSISLDQEAPVVRNLPECRGTAKEAGLELDWFGEPIRQPGTAQAGVNRQEALQIVRAREQWHDRWLESALLSVPWGTPEEYRLEVREEVDRTLHSLQPQTPELLTRQLVEGAVHRGLRTWRDLQDTEKAISSALWALPVSVRAPGLHATWQAQAREEATSAISRLSDGASFEAKLAVATAAVQKVTRQFEEQCLRQKIIDELVLLPQLNRAEKEDARAAIRSSVEGTPTGASEAELRRARQVALKPFEETQRQREERQRFERKVEQGLAHIRTLLDRLWNNGELEGFENYSEVWRYADEIREDVRADLFEELNGKQDVSDYKIQALIEDIVDELLSQ